MKRLMITLTVTLLAGVALAWGPTETKPGNAERNQRVRSVVTKARDAKGKTNAAGSAAAAANSVPALADQVKALADQVAVLTALIENLAK
jgi:hypothetical protein